MITPHRTPARRRAATAAGFVLATLLTATACSSNAQEPLTVGIPDTWPAAIDDGKERYPELGSMGMGDARWNCPFTDTIEVDGKTMDDGDTIFWKLGDGTYEVECTFFPPTPASLKFAQAEDATAFAALTTSTAASEANSNESQDAVTIGERDYILITTAYPTNPATGDSFVACYLDETTLSRACLDVSHSDERSEDYDAQQAAEDLAAILT